MKKRYFNYLVFPFLMLLLATGCKKKGCTDVTATNYNSEAEKDDGTCIPDPRNPYLGSYSVADSVFYDGVFNHVNNYVLIVSTEGTVADSIYLKNWKGYGDNYLALMASANFSVSYQDFPGSVPGDGSFSGNNISYVSDAGGLKVKGHGTK